jgi:very-short-patch-repair endonuclease
VGEERQTVGRRGAEGRHSGLFKLASAQHGVVSTRQLDGLGYSPSSAAKAAKAGRLRRVHRGVYAVGHDPLTWQGRCMAAVLAARPALASHLSAAWLWDLLRYRPERIQVIAPTARRARRDFGVHFGVVDAVDIASVESIPLTSIARTQLDLAAIWASVSVERTLERAEELRRFDLVALEGVLGRYPHHPGAGALRRALAIYRPEPAFTRSGVEKRFLELVRRARLPPPAMNYVVAGMELDAYWEDERFVVELDVYETHGTRAAFERDRIRQDDLLALGIEMIRVTGPRLRREPDEVMRRLAEHLERRRAQ